MPTGYRLNPNIQMKIEDERAGRLDFVYETSLTASECLDRIGSPVSGKLSEYETKTEDGILYISFTDQTKDTGGLFVAPPQKYAVRFDSAEDKTVIRVRYVWENETISVPYLLREDIDAFFSALFDASVSESDSRVWTDSAEEYAQKDPLKIHGTKAFWVISTVFVIVWILAFFFMSVSK
jgi:hypothetical protein